MGDIWANYLRSPIGRKRSEEFAECLFLFLNNANPLQKSNSVRAEEVAPEGALPVLPNSAITGREEIDLREQGMLSRLPRCEDERRIKECVSNTNPVGKKEG